jgi:hypothetical protein
LIRLEKRRPFRSAAATAAARRITTAAAVIGLVIKIGHLLFALALEAAHHVLKAHVIGTDGERVYTVEGNSGDACKIKSYPVNYSCIKGYGLMNWN